MKITFIVIYVCVKSITCTIVKVDEGELEGTTTELSNGRIIQAFYGVPYADPPVGENRFQVPVPRKPWMGIWNASVASNICLQNHQFTKSVMGEEDCLYLNIFTTKLPQESGNLLMDVMVFLHGGAFMFGSGSHTVPQYIMKNEDIIFVAVNYRLNIFGFFSTEDSAMPGNNGLKDQVAALKWIKKNIIHFGGNPDSVTIIGSSAGGASVHYQFVSPLSEGLFHRGISLSGSMLPPWTLSRNNSQKSLKFASLLGCPTSNTESMLECLRARPAKQLIEATKYFQFWRYYPFSPFGPVVEPPHPGAFLLEEPVKLLKLGKVKNLPWLIGLCKDEGLYPAADFIAEELTLKELNQRWYEIAPHLLMYNFSTSSEAEKNEISSKVKKFYFDNKPISKGTIREIIQLLSDRHFFNDITAATKLHASGATNRNIFCYLFNYRGKYSQTNYLTNSTVDYGISHADDGYYVFSIPYLRFNAEESESDANMVKLMCNIFQTFMKTGKPVIQGEVWKPVSKNWNDNLQCLNIHSPTAQEMFTIQNERTIKFWQDLIPSEYALQRSENISQNRLIDDL